jgi:hypothetical protein
VRDWFTYSIVLLHLKNMAGGKKVLKLRAAKAVSEGVRE